MTKRRPHPYRDLPESAYWSTAVGRDAPEALDPMSKPPFTIGPKDKVATAGSCFAQHIGRHLAARGSNYLVTEAPHPLLSADAVARTGYGMFTARYGNIYTARQLVQTFDRAYGGFEPLEDVWEEDDGSWRDPFRPNIQLGGFNSRRELQLDRRRHYGAIRTAVETLDVFVFTLGLTEAWRARADGAVFPVCPGVNGGRFDPARHEFVNFRVSDVVEDLTGFLARLRAVNPKSRVILTVSPVPLAATAAARHVLASTVYSKSVLRAAAQEVADSHKSVVYFPSYEIVASGFGGRYYDRDRRSVTAEGVAHVMRVFDRHFFVSGERGLSAGGLIRKIARAVRPHESRPEMEQVAAALQVQCDEQALDLPASADVADRT